MIELQSMCFIVIQITWNRSIITCDIPTRSHMRFMPFYLMHRRKEDESTCKQSKHHGAAKESTSEQQRSVLVVRQAGR